MPELSVPNHHSALKDSREIAELLGIYISTFARIELSTLGVFCSLTGASQSAGQLIFHQLNNFSGRLSMLQDLIEELPKDSCDRDVKSLLDEISAENGHRNILAHGIYANDSDGNLSVVSNATKVRQKPKIVPVSIETMTERCRQAEAILQRLGEFHPKD